jgi:hypothetical protein
MEFESTTLPDSDNDTATTEYSDSATLPLAPRTKGDQIDPTQLSNEESDTIGFLSDAAIDAIPLPLLATLTADEIFGDQIDENNESLFLGEIIDETQPLQSELVARLSTLFDTKGFTEPDRFSFQVFKRKAGYGAKDKRLPKSITRDPEDKSDPDIAELGQYCSAICLRDFQVIKFDNDEHFISSGKMTPVFELKPHPNKKSKLAPRPSVPKNRTQVKLGKGKATVKSRKYICFLVWVFWDGYPNKESSIESDTSPLQGVIDGLKSTVINRENQNTPPLEMEKEKEKGINIYNSSEEAAEIEGANIIVPEYMKWDQMKEKSNKGTLLTMINE